jgi:hypothetical protein
MIRVVKTSPGTPRLTGTRGGRRHINAQSLGCRITGRAGHPTPLRQRQTIVPPEKPPDDLPLQRPGAIPRRRNKHRVLLLTEPQIHSWHSTTVVPERC